MTAQTHAAEIAAHYERRGLSRIALARALHRHARLLGALDPAVAVGLVALARVTFGNVPGRYRRVA